MISNSWNKGAGESLSQKVMGRVRPDEPLKNKIEFAQRKLQSQITKLEGIDIKLQRKHDIIFEKIVNAQKTHNNGYAKAYANELSQLRKMKNMVSGAKLSMEQVQIRLSTVSELGDVIVTLSPAMSLIKGISSSLGGIMPEANASMQDLSQILGDVLTGSSINDTDVMSAGISENSDSLAILEEANSVIEGHTRAFIPEVPNHLKHEIIQRRAVDVLL
ncbi:MAG TPA: hypothetical protein VMW55_09655 [Nitrosopumilaceae archaeon]|nr:hypothetical protein [Nitrosopumilaceae archaeon]